MSQPLAPITVCAFAQFVLADALIFADIAEEIELFVKLSTDVREVEVPAPMVYLSKSGFTLLYYEI